MPNSLSPAVQAKKILKNIKDISFVQFDANDIVRHRLVRDIVNAYDAFYKKELARKEALKKDKNDKK